MRNLLLLVLLLFTMVQATPITVTFLNPGNKVNDPFWGRVSSVLNAAAKDLNISIEIINTERNIINAIEIAHQVCKRSVKPDFLLLVNEDGIAEWIIPAADSAGIKMVVFNEGFSPHYIKKHGEPLFTYKNCIAEILPNDSLAGYLLAKDLIRQARIKTPSKNLSIFGIEGCTRGTSSERRVAGLKQAVRESENVTLLQTVPANWERDKSASIMRQAIRRYPSIDIVWCASDFMAEGALQIKNAKKQAFIIGGIDWAEFAFDRIRSSEFASSVGGHFFDGAWALVVIKDYMLIGKKHTEILKANSFAVANKENISTLFPVLRKNNWETIDFNRYLLSSRSKSYHFRLRPILKDFGVHE